MTRTSTHYFYKLVLAILVLSSAQNHPAVSQSERRNNNGHVENSLPRGSLKLDKTAGVCPLTVSIVEPVEVERKARSLSPDAFYGWGPGLSIDWGDGSKWNGRGSLSGLNSLHKHTYTVPGAYKVKVTVYHLGPTDASYTDWEGSAEVKVSGSSPFKPALTLLGPSKETIYKFGQLPVAEYLLSTDKMVDLIFEVKDKNGTLIARQSLNGIAYNLGKQKYSVRISDTKAYYDSIKSGENKFKLYLTVTDNSGKQIHTKESDFFTMSNEYDSHKLRVARVPANFPMQGRVTYDSYSPDNLSYILDWGDGSPPERHITPVKTTALTRKKTFEFKHDYKKPGSYKVVIQTNDSSPLKKFEKPPFIETVRLQIGETPDSMKQGKGKVSGKISFVKSISKPDLTAAQKSKMLESAVLKFMLDTGHAPKQSPPENPCFDCQPGPDGRFSIDLPAGKYVALFDPQDFSHPEPGAFQMFLQPRTFAGQTAYVYGLPKRLTLKSSSSLNLQVELDPQGYTERLHNKIAAQNPRGLFEGYRNPAYNVKIGSSGSIEKIELARSSESAKLDAIGESLIIKAAPFEALPTGANGSHNFFVAFEKIPALSDSKFKLPKNLPANSGSSGDISKLVSGAALKIYWPRGGEHFNIKDGLDCFYAKTGDYKARSTSKFYLVSQSNNWKELYSKVQNRTDWCSLVRGLAKESYADGSPILAGKYRLGIRSFMRAGSTSSQIPPYNADKDKLVAEACSNEFMFESKNVKGDSINAAIWKQLTLESELAKFWPREQLDIWQAHSDPGFPMQKRQATAPQVQVFYDPRRVRRGEPL